MAKPNNASRQERSTGFKASIRPYRGRCAMSVPTKRPWGDCQEKRGRAFRSDAQTDFGSGRARWAGERLWAEYEIHAAGFNLGALVRALFGRGMPKEAAEATKGLVLIARTNLAWATLIVAVIDNKFALIALAVSASVI